MVSNQLPRSAFLARLWSMAEESDTLFPNCCGWNTQGNLFVIHDKDAFETKVLPHYSSSSNLKSFIRQLNRHGFRKERSSSQLME
mmetsp:Transcript_53943/g.107051  ORF Transcript_53943/g.107051 Transcript_53943/m.107051 type:complete len:85 (+) Transcript_53943:106-360(+)